jgi:acyl-CoA reductase-like NAD-dependent aldehyde dehydrogenase
MKIINPATEQVVGDITEDTANTVQAKFDRARTAQKKWAATPFSARLESVKKFRSLVANDKERLSGILTSEVGKPLSQSRNEINGFLGRVDFFIENAGPVLEPETVLNDQKAGMEERITHEPLGVIANISAWNYPYLVGSNVFVPALLTGNAVLYKPSEFAALTGQAIAELWHKAGVPLDVFACIQGTGSVGAEILKQNINGVFFTGSYATGKKIAEAVAGKLIKVQLELGGKDPVYICEDVADIKAVAEGTADGAFYNAGQSCCSVERIYVHEKIYDKFVEAFVQSVKGFVSGDPRDEKTYIGPVTRKAQLAVLKAQVDDAVAKGGRLMTGGHVRSDSQGYYFEPTVIVDASHKMELMRDESFGPVIGIQKVKSDEEAVTLMNDTAYGLTAGVYTPVKERAVKILEQINSGTAYWNCCDRVSPRLPWSGRGHSGLGNTLSRSGILAFTQPKAYHLRK